MKTFRNLFIKDDNEEEEQQQESSSEKPGFPVSESTRSNAPAPITSNPYLDEILDVYEKGLESINMPGYDFFDFYKALRAAGVQSEASFKMAFQMGKTMDPSITPQKLLSDADYYISKLNDVYQSYSEQGKQKLDSLESELSKERDKLTQEATRIEADINSMKQQIQSLEKSLAETKSSLGKIDEAYKPQKETIQQKLAANDKARELCVQKLASTKDNLSKYLK